jgi:hypothetical protein
MDKRCDVGQYQEIVNNNRHDASTYQVLQPSLAVYVSPASISMPLMRQVAGASGHDLNSQLFPGSRDAKVPSGHSDTSMAQASSSSGQRRKAQLLAGSRDA